MRHFDISDWTDYIRGVTPPETSREMRCHLEVCPRCTQTVALLDQVRAVAAEDRKFEPPAELVAAAARIFTTASFQTEQRWLGLDRVLAHLSWDSFANASAGARSAAPSSHHVLYQAGRYCVDLRIEREPETSSVTLAGQLADEETPDVPLRGVPILLSSRKRLIAQTASNELGEFSLAFRHQRHLYLRVPLLDAGRLLEIRLPQHETK